MMQLPQSSASDVAPAEGSPEQASRQSRLTEWVVDRFRWQSLREIGEVFLALFAALAVMGIMIALMGENPFEAYLVMIKGSLTTKNGIAETLVRATPLILIGLGMSIAFRSAMWNIGAEGQLYIGALGATLVSLYLTGLPPVLHVGLAMIAGFAFGAVWGGIPGYLRAKWHANEIVITIMFNHLAVLILGYLLAGPMKDTSTLVPQPQTGIIQETAFLPRLIPGTRAHYGFLLVIIAVAITWFFFKRTTLGYEMRAVGASPRVAAYGGISVVLVSTLAMALSSGLVGLAGMIEVAGVHRYLILGISSNFMFLGIAVALFGGLNPVGILFSGLLFAAFMVGAEAMQRSVGIPTAAILLVQGLAVIFMLARRVIRRKR